jgi:uncharacterized protein with PQ loop repeat
MNINLPIIVSILAPILTFSQLIPQLYKTYQTKRVKDLSIHTIFIIFLSNVLWFIHGLYIQDITLIFSGTVSSIISFLMLILYFIHNK